MKLKVSNLLTICVLALSMAFLVSLFIPAYAAGADEKAPKADKNKKDNKKKSKIVPSMYFKLDKLTDKQKAELEKLFGQTEKGKKIQAARTEMNGLVKGSPEREAKKKEMDDLRAELDKEAGKILTAEQKKQYDELLQAQKKDKGPAKEQGKKEGNKVKGQKGGGE